jgi:hypothetical protein
LILNTFPRLVGYNGRTCPQKQGHDQRLRLTMTWKKSSLFLLLWIVLVGCGAQSDPPSRATLTPLPTLTPTFRLLGPALGSTPEGDHGHSGVCSEESGCVVLPTPADLPTSALPLRLERVGDLQVGIPEGYSPLVLEEEIIISQAVLQSPGAFIVSVRRVDAESLTPLMQRFNNPDWEAGTPIQAGAVQGVWLPTGDYGAIALLTAPSGAQVWVEGSAESRYWSAYLATFLAMVAALVF